MKTLKRIIRGLGYVPGYGSHPGIPWLVLFVSTGAVFGGLLGALMMFAGLGPLVAIGAYERGKQ